MKTLKGFNQFIEEGYEDVQDTVEAGYSADHYGEGELEKIYNFLASEEWRQPSGRKTQ